MQVQIVVFSAPKEGYEPAEWEDGAAAGAFGAAPFGARGEAGGGDPPRVRFAVADGATESYDTQRWVSQLVGSFMASSRPEGPPGAGRGPELEPASLAAWLTAMQRQWQAAAPAAGDYIEQVKMRRGTLATFVGGQISGLDTPAPAWTAFALGDSVLFHVRDGRLLDQVPPLGSADFGSAPDGISTLTERLDSMNEQAQFRQGRLAPGDMIFAATDAFAQWMIACLERGEPALWPLLGGLVHPAAFTTLVAAHRRSKAMKDDDVTLLRIRALAGPPTSVVVCL
jgi:hypothetical protein